MAYSNSSRSATLGLGDRFAALVAAVKVAVENRRLYNQTLRELSNLTDRELSDLGMHRASIRQIAAEAAYGK